MTLLTFEKEKKSYGAKSEEVQRISNGPYIFSANNFPSTLAAETSFPKEFLKEKLKKHYK